MATKHLPDKEELIEAVFKNCVIMIFLIKASKLARNKILSILESLQKSNWMIFLDRLNTSQDQNTLSIMLLKMLAQELTSKEKAFKPYWTPVYTELSEKLLLHTETGSQDLVLTSLNLSLQKQEDVSQSWIVKKTVPANMNSHKTYYPSFISLTVGKWEKEVIKKSKYKSVKIKIYPTKAQKIELDNIIHVHRYVYNRTLDYIKNKGYQSNFINLRNILATERTKMNSSSYKFYNLVIDKLKEKILKEKDEMKKEELQELLELEESDFKTVLKKVPYINNYMINNFELSVSNEIRSNAIKSICDAYKTGFENLKNGNIKFFNPTFKSKSEPTKCFELASSEISMKNGNINICPGKLGKNSIFKISNKNSKKYGKIEIKHNCDLILQKGLYYVMVTVPTVFSEKTVESKPTICGGDPGIRTFLTTYNNKGEIFEYKNDRTYMKKLNNKLKFLKSLRTRPRKKEERNRYRKKQLNKIEKKKIDLINNLHWNVINHLVKTNDVIFYGDIKSHNIVKNNKNKTLNRDFNDLKFFIFKNRLLYKATIKGKKVSFINESYTTQYCSDCGYLKKNVRDSEIYNCNKCKKSFGRDENSAKNIMMKGILQC